MSELREAAQAVVAYHDAMYEGAMSDAAIDRLRAALAQPETDAGVSWGGHNVRGDADSIAEVRRLIDFEQARQGAKPATGDDLRVYDAIAANYVNAEPVVWRVRWIDPEEGPGDWVPTRDPDFYRSRPNYEVRPLYAHPPRDEWRPEDGRRYRYLKSFCSPMGLDADNNHPWTCRINPSRMRGASVDEALDAAMERDGWRDVTPPTEGAR